MSALKLSLSQYEVELCIDGLTTMMKEMDSHHDHGAPIPADHYGTRAEMERLRLRLRDELTKEAEDSPEQDESEMTPEEWFLHHVGDPDERLARLRPMVEFVDRLGKQQVTREQ